MVKKLLFTLLLAALLMVPAAAVADLQVIDDANVIDAAVEQQIAAVIERTEKEHQVDLVVLVTYDVPDDYSESLYRVQNYADEYYDNGGYGLGDDFSGMLYLIDLNNRVQWISTGGVMIGYINDMREERIFDAAEPYLMNEDWGHAALMAMQRTSQYMDEGRMKGSFLYDEETGRRTSGLYNPLEVHEVLLAAVGGAAVALLFVGSVSASYSLKGSTYRYDLGSNSSCDVTRDDEVYLRQTVSRMARSSGGSGHGGHGGGVSRGSGVHRSSSGRSHGGGGRRF